ncbi:hypothetical protein AB205_0084780 [Aquarana catesbeiana]|uniref:Uncharacterized protein n=1 Tax=Aquarana catesbeiana TaxID=8400 RepID=A0A2G9RVG0_AQUCT|nr:hypothetical protein AB205_0084780 [Aquarana catesbeiana]
MLMRTRASSQQPWPLVVGVCGRGLIGIREPPLIRGPPDPSPPPYVNEYGVHGTPTHSPRQKSVNKKTQYTGFQSNLLGSSGVFFRLQGGPLPTSGVSPASSPGVRIFCRLHRYLLPLFCQRWSRLLDRLLPSSLPEMLTQRSLQLQWSLNALQRTYIGGDPAPLCHHSPWACWDCDGLGGVVTG